MRSARDPRNQFSVIMLWGALMISEEHSSSRRVASISVFCALWVVLNITLGPIGFSLFGLPVLHSFAVFFTLVLSTWVIGKFGGASLVGIIGSVVTVLLGGPAPTLIFGASAVVFDFSMSAGSHRISSKPRGLIVTIVSVGVAAYFAGITNGLLFFDRSFEWAATFWSAWNLLGGLIGLAVAFPVIGALKKVLIR